ncbi:hypothetical protein [Devosia riboflavina]|uniref:hypothetical protein n=1 Tax=Devosia riboflavina TaxID=46914 RepID=UPI000AE0187A|nr:hypothetical protein [Devosia riboflavina]
MDQVKRIARGALGVVVLVGMLVVLCFGMAEMQREYPDGLPLLVIRSTPAN